MSDPLFVPPLTFFDLPLTRDFRSARIVLFGIPFDCVHDGIRFGSRLGPNAIRHASVLTAESLEDAEPPLLATNHVVDAGNVNVNCNDLPGAFESIERATREILGTGCVPLAVGGDGTVSLPLLRGVAHEHGPVALLHFDAHTDAWPLPAFDHYDNATQFTHAMNEGLLDMTRAVHIGVRGPVNVEGAIGHARNLGFEVLPFEECRARGEDWLLAHLRERVSGCKVYLSLDMDFFDSSVAPGVPLPTPGGASAGEGLGILRGLKGLDIVAMDINAMTPVHDPGDVTAILSAAALAELVALVVPQMP